MPYSSQILVYHPLVLSFFLHLLHDLPYHSTPTTRHDRTLAPIGYLLLVSPPTRSLAHSLRSCPRSRKQDWHGIFLRFDRDDSGTIDRKELHAALLGFGFSLPPEMVRRLEKRFAPPPQPGVEGGGKKGISFDRFLLACVTVKHYTEAFRK